MGSAVLWAADLTKGNTVLWAADLTKGNTVLWAADLTKGKHSFMGCRSDFQPTARAERNERFFLIDQGKGLFFFFFLKLGRAHTVER